MSDFVTELRREVVGAHAAHRVGAARTRRRRRVPQVGWAIALAALLVAAVVILRAIPRPEPTTEPRVLKVVRIGGNPADGVFAYGSLWVTDFAGRRIVRIDPADGKPIGDVKLDETPDQIAAGAGSLWAVGETAQYPDTRLWRIDPARLRIVNEVDRPDGLNTIAANADAAWQSARTGLVRRIPGAGGRQRQVAFQLPNGISAAGRWVWVVAQDGSVARIDAGTARIAHRWTRLGSTGQEDATEAIVADPRGAWFLSSGQGQILRLEGDKVVKVLQIEPPGESILARARDGLWVVPSSEPGQASVARIDPRTGHETARVQLGDHYPRALVPVRGGLWVIAGDGTAVLID